MGAHRVIVSLATGRGSYPARLTRLQASVRRVGFRGEVEYWLPGRFPAGCPDHLEVPFAFKPFCLAEARARGFESALWLDTSCVAIRPLEPLFAAVEERGYLLFASDTAKVGSWASDVALEVLGVSRDDAMAIPEVNAAAVGLRFDHPLASSFLSAWRELAAGGVTFRGTRERLATWDDYADVKWNRSGRISSDPRVLGHRHDQTVAGVLAHRMGMELAAEGVQGYSRGDRVRLVRPDTVVVLDRRQLGVAARWALRARRDMHLGRLAHSLALR